ncbi:MAG: hypothetical protein ACO3X1_14745 [Burkholderiaceae bacterium]
MDVQESTEMQEGQQPEVDRRSMLEEGLEAAERGEPIEVKPRDEQGRFARQQEKEEAEPPVWRRPPASWKKDYHEVWAKADPRMQEYAWQREEQMRAGVEPLIAKAQFADSMNKVIEPYMPTIQGMGLSPEQAVGALMQADYALRTSNPQQKLQLFMQLAQSYGIQLPTQGAPQQQGQRSVDPLVWQLQNELNNVRGEVIGWKQQQEMQQNQQLLNEINQFSLKAEHFEEARPAMIQLLQSGMAETLEDAYDKAIRLNPDLFEQVSKAQQAEQAAKQAKEYTRAAKVARAAAVSVRSATPGAHTAPKAANRRALLEEAFSESDARL